MKKAWRKPIIQLLDARATAQTDADALLWDPNHAGDLGDPTNPNSETRSAFGAAHNSADHSS
jgi:hypothetical protein